MRKCGVDKTFYNVTGLVFPPTSRHVTGPIRAKPESRCIKGASRLYPPDENGDQKIFRTRSRRNTRVHCRQHPRRKTRCKTWRMVSLSRNHQTRSPEPAHYPTPNSRFTSAIFNGFQQSGNAGIFSEEASRRAILKNNWLRKAEAEFNKVYQTYKAVPPLLHSFDEEKSFLSFERWFFSYLDQEQG